MKATLLLALVLIALCPTVRALITVNGISNQEISNDSATFNIPSEPGFSIVAVLDGTPVALDTDLTLAAPGYHELAITKTNISDLGEESELIQFIVLDTNRGTSERGLVSWTPSPTLDSAPEAFTEASLEVITPGTLPTGFEIPLVTRLTDSASGEGLRLNGTVAVPEAGTSLRLLRGFGSAVLPAPEGAGTLVLTPTLNRLSAPSPVIVEQATSWTKISSDLTTSTDWGANARIHITANLTIAPGVTLTVGPGSVLQLDPGIEVRIEGELLIQGSTIASVVVTKVPGQGEWGGFLLQGATASVTATGAFFLGSGADPDWFDDTDYSTHRDEQATFLFDTGTVGSFTNCFFLDLPGQALHGNEATISLSGCLFQRLPTVGQFNGGSVTVTNSALIEFERDDNQFADDDNDGIYFTAGSHRLIDTLIGWAKDDGVDAGSGDSGDVTVQDCWFEACYHEAMAWSGPGRTVTVSNTVALNCGQGIEAGWSGDPDNNSPIVTVRNSLCLGNHVGWRYGDNYDWDYDGQLNVSNSISLHNDRDVWGFEWDSWSYRGEKMTIENNKLSGFDGRHPANSTWDPAADAALLAPFAPVPDGPVGAGFGEWSLQRALGEYDRGVVLALSEFTTGTPSLHYEVAIDSRVIQRGTLPFDPGEIRKALPLPALTNSPRNFVRVTLTGATGAALTTARTLYFLPEADGEPRTLITAGASWRYLANGTDQGAVWRDPAFDDTAWPEASAQLGYGDGDEATVINNLNAANGLIATTYFRHSFAVDDPAAVGRLEIGLLRDDGAIVYLNGEEVFRSNIDPGPVAFDTFTENVTSDEEEELYYSKSIPSSHLQAGTNVIAVEVHQANDTSSDVSFDLELVAHPPTPIIFLILQAASEATLLWQGDDLRLQASPSLQSGWADQPDAMSPLLLRPGEPDSQQFYRLVK